MGGAIQPLGYGQARNTSNYGSGFDIANYDFNQATPGMNEDLSQYGIDVGGTINPMQGGSSFMDMFSGGNKGFGSSFAGQIPGYIFAEMSRRDQNKTNKLNREATRYAIDRKKTEDKAYDKFQSGWANVKF